MRDWQSDGDGVVPDWFAPLRAEPQLQCELFREPLATFLGRMRISRAELDRWCRAGWITFDVDGKSELQSFELRELVFVSDVAQSGLPESAITQLLSKLPKPRPFWPDSAVYSFKYGWMDVVARRQSVGSLFFELHSHGYDWLWQIPDAAERNQVGALWKAFIDKATEIENRKRVRQWEEDQCE